MAEALPVFRFHPDPVRSGSIERTDGVCLCCGRRRGFCHAGSGYCEQELARVLCPWCIADGAAHARFGVTFHDAATLPDVADAAALAEIEQRTPSFASWNPVDWPACCGAPMAYLEPAGIAEIRVRHRDLEGQLLSTIVHDLGMSGGLAHRMLASLHRDHGPTAHLFRCITCQSLRAPIDLP
jgi:uncharacterized protein